MAISKAQQQAVAKYSKANYDNIFVRVYKGARAEIQAHAAAQGESVNAYIVDAVKSRMAAEDAAQQGKDPGAPKLDAPADD